MKQRFIIILCLLALLGFSLANSTSSLVAGSYFTKTQEPVAASDRTKTLDSHSASNYSILGLVAFGDSSIRRMSSESDIRKISHIEKETFSFLGIFVEEKFTIYGEKGE